MLCPARVATQVADEPKPSGEKRHNFAVLSSEPVAKRGAVGFEVYYNPSGELAQRVGKFNVNIEK